MKCGSHSCVNFGKCLEAGKLIEYDTAQGSICEECDHPLISIKSTSSALSIFLVIAVILALGSFVIFQSIHIRILRADRDTTTSDYRIVSADTLSIASSEYFVDPQKGILLEMASKGDRVAVSKLLVDRPELRRMTLIGSINALHAAMFSYDKKAFETLLAEGFDPNAGARNEMTLFMVAAKHPNPRFLVATLDKVGKVPEQTDGKLRNEHDIAVANRQSENVRLVHRHGVNPNSSDLNGNTALMVAFQGRRPKPDTVRLLLDAGADPLLADKGGFNARDFAATFNDPLIISLLP
jgi:hypothetical protein